MVGADGRRSARRSVQGGMITVALGTLLLAVGCGAGEEADAAAASPQHDQNDGVHVPGQGPRLSVDRPRDTLNIAGGGTAAPYNYAPSVMADGSTTRMWWCSQLPDAGPPGDDILYAQAPGIDGPYGSNGVAATAALSGSGGTAFDAKHTCDPSVIRVGGTYYMYYTGAAGDKAHGNAIGMAKSTDGTTWQRNGEPIVRPSLGNDGQNTYGAGQPSALYLDGWFYLLYTDTSSRSAGDNGAGQFVLRAKDPTFTEQVQMLTGSGFTDKGMLAPGNEKNLVDAFSADWMFSDALDAFALAHETKHGTEITFFDRNLRSQPYQPVLLTGPWQEGPGLARRGDGHAPVSTSDPCSRVPLDVVRATVTPNAPSNLSHFGLDVTGVHGCATPGRALGLLRGYGVLSPQRTVYLVVDGGIVRVERRSVAEALALGVLDTRVPALDGAPMLADLAPAAPGITATGRPLGLMLSDGKLWPVGKDELARLNSSPVQTVSPDRWDIYPSGSDLSRLRG
ncbi:family 43 glycosylhydrolase [Sciscionella sediminilitoris]|uniref:family 43 glycosylhydrolase n=1 Tax=Sciscionella sediminilitoris TaxID=1445613 RepID=UPI001E499FBC|nr:family 43 glycosylhydrolase [Sciscionella sp. SE31]